MQGDFGDAETRARLLELSGGPADVLLCDAAPKLTGIRAADRAAEELLLDALAVSLPELLRAGGAMVAKLLESPEAQHFAKTIKRRFQKTDVHGLKATRRGSAERYLLGRDFLGEG